MPYTYDRSCGHCKPSKYVQKVTVKELLPIAKADKLEVVAFNEIGYTTVGGRFAKVVSTKYLEDNKRTETH